MTVKELKSWPTVESMLPLYMAIVILSTGQIWANIETPQSTVQAFLVRSMQWHGDCIILVVKKFGQTFTNLTRLQGRMEMLSICQIREIWFFMGFISITHHCSPIDLLLSYYYIFKWAFFTINFLGVGLRKLWVDYSWIGTCWNLQSAWKNKQLELTLRKLKDFFRINKA